MTMFALETHEKEHSINDPNKRAIKVEPSSSTNPHVISPQIRFSQIPPNLQPPLKKIKLNNLPAELSKSKNLIGQETIKMMNDDKRPLLTCAICNFKTMKELFFMDHMHKVHNRFGDLEQMKRYSCTVCSNAFDSLLLFVAHKSKCKPLKATEPVKKSK